MKTGPPGRRGFTLIELAAVLWTVGILLMLGTATLIGALQVRNAAADLQDRMALRDALSDQFREDVGLASVAPDALDAFQASPTCLLLRLADGRLVVYRWKDGRLERVVRDGPKSVTRRLPLGPDIVALEFIRGAGGKLLSVRLTEARGREPKLQRQSTIVAALGGELR